jgi:mannan endo-1,4-beta-mannosidase
MKRNRKWFAAGLAAVMAVNAVCLSSFFSSAAADGIKVEFEDGAITGTSTEVEEDTSASGGKVVHLKDAGDTLTVTVNVETAGMYDLTICYATDGGAKTQKMNINGTPQSDIALSNHETLSESKVATVKLAAGENTIEIVSYWGWTKFDYLTLTEPVYPTLSASSTLADANATSETQSLMNYLASVYGEHILSGQQEIYKYGPHDFEYEFDYIQETTGELPAIRGFDYLNCNPLYGSDDGTTDRIISWVKDKNGIATSSWHITVPKNFENYTLGSSVAWADSTYVPSETDFDPSKILEDGTKEREYYLLCLKGLAAELQELQDAGVPLIFRPLHEAEGGGGETGSWFWWGKSGSAVYKELWKLTYQTLTEEYGLHNLIWEWNSYDYETSADWYPGDEYVDLIAYDKYNCTDWSTGSAVLVHNDSAISGTFYDLVNMYNGNKMIAMSENDSIPTLENLLTEKAGWLYFLPWYDGGSDSTNFLSNSVFNDPEDLKTIYQSEYCITLDELPENLYSNSGALVTTTTGEGGTTSTTKKTTTTTTTTTTKPQEEGRLAADLEESASGVAISFDQAMGDTVYLDFDADSAVSYANGCMGISVTVDDTDYWVAYKWEIQKSGEVAVALNDTPYEISYNNGKSKVTDADEIAKIVAAAQKEKSAEVQVWWANDGSGDSVATSKVSLTAAYILDNGSEETTTEATTTTTTESTTIASAEETTTVTTTTTALPDSVKYGDVDLNGVVDLIDVVVLNKYMAGIVDLSDTQKANANCNTADGTENLTDEDASALLQFVIMLVKDLPVTE